MKAFANALFLETTSRRLVASPTGTSLATPLAMPFSDEGAYMDVHLLAFDGRKQNYLDSGDLSAFAAAVLTISSPDGSDVIAEGAGLNFFPVQVTVVDSFQTGGGGFNAIHEVRIAPQEGYFALRMDPAFDAELAKLRTQAFDNLSWQAQEIEDALNEILGAVGTVRVSKVSDFIFHIEYTGELSDTDVPDLPQVSQKALTASGLSFTLAFDDTKRAMVTAAPNGYQARLTLRGYFTMSSTEHVLFSVPITIFNTPDLT